ncbi:methyltransferase domain-containing protein [Actinobacteria bacterium IMCC25003]|nr:methyltransferase domain-containing protein [Actinobacteria bacterium IMCC25003]
MTAYLTVVSTLILIAVSYQIRLMRRMNGSLVKLASPERDVRRIAKSQREASRENYRQSEFYAQLIRLLDLSAPIPATRSWAASPDVLLTLLDLAKSAKPSRILDLGSGMSTLVLAKSAPQATVISIDNSPEYAEKTQKLLASHGISNVEIRVAPLTPHSSGVDWYELSQLHDVSNIDLLFIDGPPGSKNPKARYPAIAECIAKLSPRAVIVIDDAGRDGERDMAQEFAKALPSHTLEFLLHEKGTAVLLPK